MFKVSASGLTESLAMLTALERTHLPRAATVALTKTAYDLRERLVQEMESVFDRPTRYTLNSLKVYPAKPNRLEARVQMKNEASKAEPATKWLAPEIYGGPRPEKRIERQLRERGVLPTGKYIVPGAGAKLDAHGNMSRGQLTKAVSGIKGYTQVGYDANATASKRSSRKRNAQRYFVLKRGKDPIGIAERTGRGKGAMQMIVGFVGKPSYSKALRFYEIADQFVADRLPQRFAEALAKELKYASR